MPDRNKIICMTRLAILEKEYGRELAEADSTFLYDWVVSRMLRAFFAATCIFIAAAGLWALCSIDFVLSLLDGEGIRDLAAFLLVIYVVFVTVVLLTSAFLAAGSRRRAGEALQERDSLLEMLDDEEQGSERRETR